MPPVTDDPRWPRAAAWLAAGPGGGRPDLAVLGIPTHVTSLSKTGAHATPRAVRRALARYSTWCASRGVDLADAVRPVDLGDVDDPDLGEEGEFRTRAKAAAARAAATLTVAVGGDNSLTAPLGVGSLGAEITRAGVVTLDAHHDIREGRSNGSPVRRLMEAGVDPHRIVQVGIADWANSRSYADEAHARGITVLPRHEVVRRGMFDAMSDALDLAGSGGGPVLVDLDLDVCDRAVAPACPASLPGGLGANDVLTAAYLAGRDERVVAVDITEVDATADTPDERTVRLAAMCLLEAAAGMAARLSR
jgi:formiminoglutamase